MNRKCAAAFFGCIFAGYIFQKVNFADLVDNKVTVCYNLDTIYYKGECALMQNNQGLTYKNHPLRRIGNMIYYGTMAEPYIIMMQVKETRKEKDLDVATKVSVELQRTAKDLRSRDRIVKKSEKSSLYEAMDVSAIWLERALAGK